MRRRAAGGRCPEGRFNLRHSAELKAQECKDNQQKHKHGHTRSIAISRDPLGGFEAVRTKAKFESETAEGLL
jgi:hypothetical protein